MNQSKNVEVLNDLIQINNDRVAGYRKAIDELKNGDGDLKSLFARLAEESEQYIFELRQKVNEYSGDPAEGTSLAGKLYRGWMEIQSFFTGSDRETILGNCEAGEDAAQKAYRMALDEYEITGDIQLLLTQQQTGLQQSHNKIRDLRNQSF